MNKGDIWGGLASMLVALPASIAFGVLVFASIDPDLASRGALYGLMGAAVLGLVAPLIGGTPGLVSAPCAPAAAILAGLAAMLLAAGVTPERIPALLALTVLLASLLLLAFSLLKGGRFIKYIPYPVVAGYLSGVALIIVLSQLPAILGGPIGDWTPGNRNWPSLFVGSVTIAAMLIADKRLRIMPSTIIGLLAGMAAYLLVALVEPGLATLENNPMVIGTIATSGSLTGAVAINFDELSLLRFSDLQLVGYTALALAVLLSIDTLKTCVVLDAMTRGRHDSNRELLGQSVANFTAFMAGAMPGAGTMAPTLVNVASGGKTRWSGFAEGAFVLLAILLLLPLIAWIPFAVLAGILVVIAFRMVDWSAFELLKHRDTRFDFAVIATVVVVAVLADLIVASVAGVGLAILLFIRDQIHGTVLRRSTTLSETSSKTRRLEAARRLLGEFGDQAAVVDLQGNLFFGTTDQLFSEVESGLRTCRWMLFDLRRVQSMDYTAANLFRQMHHRLSERNGALLLCGMPSSLSKRQDIHSYLSQMGLLGDDRIRVFDTRDEALEWMENRILENAGWESPDEQQPLDLAEIELLSGLDEATMDALRACVRTLGVEAGEHVFRRGDEGDEVYLIRRGMIRILLPLDGGKQHHLASFGRGDYFGEMAFLDSGTRTADAVARTDCEVYILSREAFDARARENTAMGSRVFARLARAVSLRLRQTDLELRVVEER